MPKKSGLAAFASASAALAFATSYCVPFTMAVALIIVVGDGTRRSDVTTAAASRGLAASASSLSRAIAAAASCLTFSTLSASKSNFCMSRSIWSGGGSGMYMGFSHELSPVEAL